MRDKHLCALMHLRIKGKVGTVKHVHVKQLMPLCNFLTDRSKGESFCGSFLLFVFFVCVCNTVLSFITASWPLIGKG